jgi:hypothetical protein
MITKTDTIGPPSYEEAWTQSLNTLQQQIAVYETAQRSGDDKAVEQEAPKVASAMRQVGDSHTDPKVKAVWYKKADKFLRSKGAARQKVLQEVGKILVTLITIPFALTGWIICVVGDIVRGVGSGIVGLGEFIGGVGGGEKGPSNKETGKSFHRRCIISSFTFR